MRILLAAALVSGVVFSPAPSALQYVPAPEVRGPSPLALAMARRIERVNRRAPAREIVKAVTSAGRRYRIDPVFILAVAEVESSYRPGSVGRIGERGLMQIRRSTARALGLAWHDAFDVDANVDAGARYLAQHVRRYGDRRRAAARYNGGSRRYAERVMSRYYQLSLRLSGAAL